MGEAGAEENRIRPLEISRWSKPRHVALMRRNGGASPALLACSFAQSAVTFGFRQPAGRHCGDACVLLMTTVLRSSKGTTRSCE
jgi:hypothetical protein